RTGNHDRGHGHSGTGQIPERRLCRQMTFPAMQRKVFITFILIIGAAAAVCGADMSERFQARTYTSKKYSTLPYRLLVPANYDKGKKYPLVLFFHGVGERGNDNKKQLYCGLDIFANENRMKRYPCFIAAPQCPVETKWAEVDWKADR